MSIKVMLADDHVLMREGIRQLLEFDGTISVIAEANNGVECMEQLLSVHPDILLLDINMPVMNGIEVLQEIKKKNIMWFRILCHSVMHIIGGNQIDPRLSVHTEKLLVYSLLLRDPMILKLQKEISFSENILVT